jgi:hypothetical protein
MMGIAKTAPLSYVVRVADVVNQSMLSLNDDKFDAIKQH